MTGAPISASIPLAGKTPASGEVAAPLFTSDWWLDAVAPRGWERIEVRWSQQLVGSLSFCMRRRFGLRVIEMPPYTRSLGPVLSLPPAKPARTMQNVYKVVQELVARLPPHDRFEVCLEPNSEATLAFALLNFGVAQTFTFRAPPATSTSSVLEGMHQKTRNIVINASRRLCVTQSDDFSRFLAVHEQERSRGSRLDVAIVSRLFAAAAARGAATLLIASDDGARDVAASAVIWDEATLYYWLSSRAPEASGANSLLIMKAIELSRELGKEFDLDGFASINSGMFLARFGLSPVVRPYINRGGRAWKALNALSTIAAPHRIDRNYRF
jgi:Acetyltransferase (GNAT) domain